MMVIGKNEGADIPLGTTFSGIRKGRVDGDLMHLRSIDLGVVANVHLTLKQVLWFGRNIQVVPGGHAAGLMVEGEGLSVLSDALQNAAPREYVALTAPLPSRESV